MENCKEDAPESRVWTLTIQKCNKTETRLSYEIQKTPSTAKVLCKNSNRILTRFWRKSPIGDHQLLNFRSLSDYKPYNIRPLKKHHETCKSKMLRIQILSTSDNVKSKSAETIQRQPIRGRQSATAPQKTEGNLWNDKEMYSRLFPFLRINRFTEPVKEL